MERATGITLTKLRKQFGAVVAVNDLDLDIGAGEFVSLLGPSGCGKTTTLRMLAGLDFPTSGTIGFGGRVVNDVRAGQARHRHGVPVLCALSAYDGRREHRLSAAEARRAEGRAAGEGRGGRRACCSSSPISTRKPRQLSGGQQQRVALGRALVREPGIFLLDEPLSNLDAKLRAHMRAELIELHRKIGKTMVYVTHDQLEAMTMSSRIAVMRGGVLQQFGTPAEIYERPANVFVADFIGTPSMTLLDAELHWRRRCGRGPDRTARDPAAGGPCRPVTRARPPRSSSACGRRMSCSTTTAIRRPSSSSSRPAMRASCSSSSRRGVVTARVPAHVRLRGRGDAGSASAAGKLHIFDRATGLRMAGRPRP